MSKREREPPSLHLKLLARFESFNKKSGSPSWSLDDKGTTRLERDIPASPATENVKSEPRQRPGSGPNLW